MARPSPIVVKLPENFGAKGARKLKQQLKQQLSKGSPHVIVDLSHVKTIDVEGLEGLLQCMEEIAKQDGALQVGEVSPEAATLLELTRMGRIFEKFPGFAVETRVVTFEPEVAPAEVGSETTVQLPVVA